MTQSIQWLIKSADVGHANRSRILRMLHQSGPMTRAQFAEALHVNRGTVGTVVQPLLASGVLVEQEALASGGRGGKPAKPLWFGCEHRVVGVYLSADVCVAASLGLDGSIRSIDSQDIGQIDDAEVKDCILTQVKGVVGTSPHVLGVCVAFAGMVDWPSGHFLRNYRRPAISRVPLVESLRKLLKAPVYASHHPRVQAYGDYWMGDGKHLESFASVVTGEVIGLGSYQNGVISQGVRGAGGEAGHMVVDRYGEQCNCGRRGCWETVATLSWLRRSAKELDLPDAELLTTERLMALAKPDTAEYSLAHTYAESFGLGLANLEQILGVGTYIIHGDMAEGGEIMKRWVAQALARESPNRTPTPTVIFAKEPVETTLRGCAALVLSNAFPPTPVQTRNSRS